MTAAGHWQQNDRRVPSGTVFTDRGDFVSKMQAAGFTIAKEAAPADPGEKYTPVALKAARGDLQPSFGPKAWAGDPREDPGSILTLWIESLLETVEPLVVDRAKLKQNAASTRTLTQEEHWGGDPQSLMGV